MSKTTEVAIQEGVVPESIYEIQAYQSLQELIERLKDNAEWIERNRVGKRMFSNSLNHYGNFLKELNHTATHTATHTANTNEMETTPPLNQILYGPPGTGKTYNTIDKAVQIAAPDRYQSTDHDSNKEVFDELIKSGHIVFTTFHQSMSYEDFIEGLKPVSDESTQQITYNIEDGIFKKICAEARKSEIASTNFNELYDQFVENLDTEKPTVFKTLGQSREFSCYRNSMNHIVLHPHTETATSMVIKPEVIEDYLLTGKAPNLPSYVRALGKHFVVDLGYSVERSSKPNANYVLIIDEINRGNVSLIFGELITLIEKNKRQGNKEELEVTLPYSKTKFSVPNNVYIIGTMNTADRSVESLDTALRRRFSFKEMAPNPELLKSENLLWSLWSKHWDLTWDDPKWLKDESDLLSLLGGTINDEKAYKKLMDVPWAEGFVRNVFKGIVDFNGLDLRQLLNTINKRIEKLIDKDHMIGHSYFLSVKNLDDLKSTFQHNIIPLLQEYFFGDYGKIGLVLGAGFFEESEANNDENIFAVVPDYDVDALLEKRIYHLHDITQMNDQDFQEAIDLLFAK